MSDILLRILLPTPAESPGLQTVVSPALPAEFLAERLGLIDKQVMARYGKASLMGLFYLIAGISNLVILLGTAHRMLSTENARSYSKRIVLNRAGQNLRWAAGYLGSDFPIEIPAGSVPTVEITFHEVSRFSLSDYDTRRNWKTLLTNQFGTGFQHLGPYHFRFISGAYHSLHCVYNAQLAFDRPHHREHPDRHLAHCLLYMQQLFLCNADMTLEEGDFMARNITTDRVGTTRRCRDWSTVAAWVNENSRGWLKYNGVDLEI